MSAVIIAAFSGISIFSSSRPQRYRFRRPAAPSSEPSFSSDRESLPAGINKNEDEEYEEVENEDDDTEEEVEEDVSEGHRVTRGTGALVVNSASWAAVNVAFVLAGTLGATGCGSGSSGATPPQRERTRREDD